MKRYVFVVICFFLFVNSASAILSKQNTSSKSMVKLDSANITYDLGKVKKDRVITKTITIKNGLNRALNISEALSSCGCLKVEFKPQRVEKDGSVALKFTLDTTGYKDEFKSTIYILTGDKEYEVIALDIIAQVS